MFIPIGDDNPTERTPFVNYTLIAVNILAWILFALAPAHDPSQIRWMLVPADLQWPTLFTSMFLHAGFWHLFGNMVFLWIFGDNVEDRLGHLGYIVFYFACGLGASGAHILSDPSSTVPTLGASGAISGVMGAYVVFYPRAEVKTLIWFGIWYSTIVRTPAFLWLGFWFVGQILLNLLSQGAGGVAYVAHIGGFAAGAAVAGVMRGLGARWKSADPASIKDPADDAPLRRFFALGSDEPDIEWLDDAPDSYSLLRLNEDPSSIPAIAETVSAATGESREDVVRRLQSTRGMIVRQIPRKSATAIQKQLHGRGIPAALILHGKANQPPSAKPVEGASWDARTIRLRSGDQILQVPWPAPLLWVAARSEGNTFIDVFVNRRTAFRIPDSRSVLLTEIDPSGRSESAATFAALARGIRANAAPSALNEGIAFAAMQDAWGRLDFPRTRITMTMSSGSII
jgi:membrane associated rhomboid family serine protease